MTETNRLPPQLQANAEAKWDALCSAAVSAGITLPRDRQLQAVCGRVMALSDFVARSLIQRPAMLADLLAGKDLQHPYPLSTYRKRLRARLASVHAQLRGGVDPAAADPTPELASVLRKFRRREMVRIAWRDLAGWADLTETMQTLSALADACADAALICLYRWLRARWGTPRGSRGRPQQMVVVAMGKLGGGELNFSSDIDLVFAYPEAGQTRGGAQPLENQEFFHRLGRQLVAVLGAATVEGIVFRVDLRLRPYGDGGPLVMNFDALENYYQMQGRQWERYAWLKARVVAGDRRAGRMLLARLKPFVYRRYLDFGAFESLREMKRQIALEVQRRELRDDIKLGPGGIREIEFFGQVFQLIRGGVSPSLQQRSIRRVLSVLARENHVDAEVCRELEAAYIFLRNAEHRLQEFEDRQTHLLPVEPTGRLRLAAAMGFSGWPELDRALRRQRRTVQGHFDFLLEDKSLAVGESGTAAVETELEQIWQGGPRTDRQHRRLAALGFDDPEQVLSLLDSLRRETVERHPEGKIRQRLNRLVPRILIAAGPLPGPAQVLSRIADLLGAVAGRANYLALLLENPHALEHLTRLVGASSWIAAFLARHPVLLDELLDPRTLYAPASLRELRADIARRLEQLPPDDFERIIEQLCILRQVYTLRVAAADISGRLALMRVSDFLTDIAEAMVDAVLKLAWQHLTQKHGAPHALLDGTLCRQGFAVVAYGKLGGFELGYDSDLDLIFLHAGTERTTQGGPRTIDSPQFFARLGQRVVHLLTAHTAAGRLYQADTRLRPGGSSGLLVSHIEAFAEYQHDEAWTWEHQALIRARAIGGDSLLADRFEQIRRRVLARRRNGTALRREVLAMREKMRHAHPPSPEGEFNLKQDPGGIIDIEFLVQYLVLRHAHAYPELRRWTDNVRLLQTLIETGALDRDSAHLLRHAYLIYRAIVHKRGLAQQPARTAALRFKPLRSRVLAIWQRHLEPQA